MGWLKSNWLDALIFLLVAVIMAGVIYFILGVNPFSGSKNQQTTAAQSPQVTPQTPVTPNSPPTPTAEPINPQTQPTRVQPATKPANTDNQTDTKPAAAPKPTTAKPEATGPKPAATVQPQANPQQQSDQVITIIPDAPSPQADSNQPAQKPVPAPPKPTPSTPTAVAAPTPTPIQKPTVQPKPTPQVSIAAQAGGSWRLAVGSFSDSANAERLASSLRAKGYPVSLEPSGGNTRVWVGPYASAARARAVAASLGGYSPQLARIAQPTTPTTPAITNTKPTASSGYLQAGAFRSQQNAQDMASKVQQAGFPAVVLEGNGIYRVRVGPVENTATAKATLRTKGIAAVEVR